MGRILQADCREEVEGRAREEESVTTFDQLFWRSRAINDLQEAFVALQKSTGPFEGWDRVFLSASIEYFRLGLFERSATAAQRILRESHSGRSFNGRFGQPKSLADHRTEFEALLQRVPPPCESGDGCVAAPGPGLSPH
jgi:hypothetical protein